MANEEHLERLKQGVDAWNQWRQEHPEIQPDLSETNLIEAGLRKVNLSGAIMYRASLTGADLRDVNLFMADLNFADLSFANLTNADLTNAYLLTTLLTNATLTNAELRFTVLSEVNLSGADLSNATMGYTTLTALNLSQVRGLEKVQHFGPSSLGIDTIYQSHGEIPEVFLRGAGVPENFIEYMRSLTGKAFDYYSCFISYSSHDQAFAERLYADLQSKGVRCWFAPHDLKIGDKFRERIDESIRLHDKLLVILSAHSVESDWVEDEVTRALDKERQHPERTVLFPIRLDEAVMTAHHAWASGIRLKRHIGDFTGWKDHDQYQKVFAQLLRDLKAESAPPSAL